MTMVKIRRVPGNSLTWISNHVFNMAFPIEKMEFEVPEEWVPYLKGFRVVDFVEEPTAFTYTGQAAVVAQEILEIKANAKTEKVEGVVENKENKEKKKVSRIYNPLTSELKIKEP